MTWRLRSAGPGDLATIMAIENASFAGDAWQESTMRSELASTSTRYLVAETVDEPHEVVAYSGLLAPVGADDADVQTIAVTQAAQRNGIGRALMQRMMTEARDRGAAQMFLEVRADNPTAKALYDSLGFEVLAVREHYYQPDDVAAIVMRASLAAPASALATDGQEQA